VSGLFSLEFPNVEKTVRVVTIYFLRSYGEKWLGSQAKFTIGQKKDDDGTKENLVEKDISGIHPIENYTYSLTTSETIILPRPILKGDAITIDAKLVSGSHFKLMGMMICTGDRLTTSNTLCSALSLSTFQLLR